MLIDNKSEICSDQLAGQTGVNVRKGGEWAKEGLQVDFREAAELVEAGDIHCGLREAECEISRVC